MSALLIGVVAGAGYAVYDAAISGCINVWFMDKPICNDHSPKMYWLYLGGFIAWLVLALTVAGTYFLFRYYHKRQDAYSRDVASRFPPMSSNDD